MRTSKFNLAWLLFIAIFTFASCNKDDDGGSNPILVEDGMYVIGDATPWADFSLNAQMIGGINEVDGSARTSMYEKYTTLEAGKEFRIVEVAGKETIDYGPDQLIDFNTYGKYDQPNITCKWGSYKVGGTYTVSTSGLYHIVIDKELSKVAIIPVNYWAILGGATANGWSDSKMELNGSFDKNTMSFKVTDLVLRAGDFKFRYSGGWKLGIDDSLSTATVKVNTNFGGATDALVPGGDNITFDGANEGVYTVEMTWSSESSGYGYTATLTKTGDVEPLPEYPTTLYMIGSALNTVDSDGDNTPDGWEWDLTDAPMIPVHSHPYMFWKIVWLNGDQEFKFAPTKQWGQDFGKTGDMSADSVYNKGSENIKSPITSGYYMIVVDLQENKISIAEPKVYLYGSVVSTDWSGKDLFAVDPNDNEVFTLTKTLLAGELRMYADHKWFPLQTPQAVSWWQAEFNVYNNLIEFRGTGDDQEKVNVTAGDYKIDLNFKSGAGSIAAVK